MFVDKVVLVSAKCSSSASGAVIIIIIIVFFFFYFYEFFKCGLCGYCILVLKM
jgi:hypothetical protein